MSAGASAWAFAKHVSAASRYSAATRSLPRSPYALARSMFAAPERSAFEQDLVSLAQLRLHRFGSAGHIRHGQRLQRRPTRRNRRGLPGRGASDGDGKNDGHERNDGSGSSRTRRTDRAIAHFAVPSFNVVYRSMGTSVHSSTRPLGHRTRTVGRSVESPRPASTLGIVRRRVAPVRMRPAHQRRSVFSEDLHARPQHVTSVDARPGARRTGRWARGRSSSQPQADPVRAAADVVDEQPRRTIVVAHHDVHVAVVVDVAERRAAADLRELKHRAGPRGGVLELPVAKIVKQLFPLMQRKRVARLRERLDRVCTAPLTVRMSSRPSLSTSTQAVPKPVYCSVAAPRPDITLRSSNVPVPSLT